MRADEAARGHVSHRDYGHPHKETTGPNEDPPLSIPSKYTYPEPGQKIGSGSSKMLQIHRLQLRNTEKMDTVHGIK
jgi:hypothetical protein